MNGPVTRRQTLLGIAGLSVSLTGCASPASDGDGTADGPDDGDTGQPTEGTGPTTGDGESTGTDVLPGDRSLGAEVVASGMPAPLAVEEPVPGRIFVADQRGRIFLVDDGSPRAYLDIRDRLADDLGSEMGLIGVAFHPDFADNGRFYVRYSANPRPGTPDDFNHTFVLSEFEADPGGDTADTSTERTLLEIPEPQANHNCGNLVFGPAGHLFVGVGDGGWAGDQGPGHVGDWYDGVGGGNGQDVTENLLGSILRIDVEERDGGQPYGIPDDNPLVGEAGLDEHFAWGLRNPWGMSFGPEGRFFVADVGQNAWEEIDVVEKGGNYGWNVREGTHCYDRDECPSVTPDGERLRSPIIEYPHSGGAVSGTAVVGGYLYDGSGLPAFQGDYVFGDFQSGNEVFVATEAESGLWPTSAVEVDHPEFGPRITGFGRDADGEILVCCVGDGGRVLRLTEA
ncbi:MAG: PQQ-dependent sugar dehydrogenase [Haloarculaceae archaeon]